MAHIITRSLVSYRYSIGVLLREATSQSKTPLAVAPNCLQLSPLMTQELHAMVQLVNWWMLSLSIGSAAGANTSTSIE